MIIYLFYFFLPKGSVNSNAQIELEWGCKKKW